MKKVAGTLRLTLAQYRELAAFAQFGSDLDKATQEQLASGHRLTEMLKQGQYAPQRVAMQVIQLYAGTQNMPDSSKTWIRDVEATDIPRYCTELASFVASNHSDVLEQIESVGDLTPAIKKAVEGVLATFGKTFTASK